MDLVKKNLISIIFGVVALAAVGVAFFLLPTSKSDLQAKLDARKQTHDQLESLLKKNRPLPSVNPDNPTQESLSSFPNQRIIDQGDAIVKEVEKESLAIRKAAVDMNEHKLLVVGSLPNPSATGAFAFRTEYTRLLPLPAVGGASKSHFAELLKAGMPPTSAEITQAQTELAADIKKKNLFINAQGQAVNQQQVEDQVRDANQKLPKDMMQKVADSSRVYISPDTFDVNPTIAAAAGAPQATDMYFAQLGYWIQEDVVNAVNDANGASTKVVDSVVKHLIAVRFVGAQTAGGMGQGQGAPEFVFVPPPNNDPDAAIEKKPASPTGRSGNGLYDVFHFVIVADVEAAKLGDFLRALGTKRFITPLSVDVTSVDNATALSQGHYYGDKPVVRVTAHCEDLYLRKWNLPFMPKRLREALQIPDETAPGAAPAAPAAAPAAPAGEGH